MNDYQKEKIELVKLGLLIGPTSNPDPLARRGIAQSRKKAIEEARADYLAENGIEAVKAKFPRMWKELWPGLH